MQIKIIYFVFFQNFQSSILSLPITKVFPYDDETQRQSVYSHSQLLNFIFSFEIVYGQIILMVPAKCAYLFYSYAECQD